MAAKSPLTRPCPVPILTPRTVTLTPRTVTPPPARLTLTHTAPSPSPHSLVSEATYFVAVHTLCSEDLVRYVLVPANMRYLVTRYNGLAMEVLGVAVIVPNAFYPGGFALPGYVVAGDTMVAILAVMVKSLLWDAEPVAAHRHAISQSQLSELIFVSSVPLTLFSISAIGGACAIIVPQLGASGAEADTPFARTLLCAANAVFYCCLALQKALHAPRSERPAARLQQRLGWLLLLGAAAVSPVSLVMGDMDALTWTVGCAALVVVLQLLKGALFGSGLVPDVDAQKQSPSVDKAPSSAPSLSAVPE